MIEWLNTKSGLKILSVTVATLLWLVVYLDETSVLDIVVPVSLKNIPQGLVIRNEPVKQLAIRLSGPRVHLLFLHRSIGSFRLDLDGAGEGETVFTNLGMSLKLPEDVRISRIAPASVKIILGRVHGIPLKQPVQ